MTTTYPDDLKDYNWKLFVELSEKMRDRTIKGLIKFIIGSKLMSEYFSSPGSRKNHHSFEGGLAFHSLTAAKLGSKIADHYIDLEWKVNKDMVVAGTMLHDIGKIRSYAWTDTPHQHEYHGVTAEVAEPGYIHTVDGQLLHHIPIGYGLVLELAHEYNEVNSSSMISEKA